MKSVLSRLSRFFSNRWRWAWLWALSAGFVARADWDHTFVNVGGSVAVLETASVLAPETTGTFLYVEVDDTTAALVHFDDAGNELWSVALPAATASGTDPELSADFENEGILFATFHTPGDGRLHTGAFNTADLSARFTRSFALQGTIDELTLNQLPGPRGAFVETLGDMVHVLLLDATGAVVFDRNYSGAALEAPTLGGRQWASLFPAGDEYRLVVQTIGAATVDPETSELIYPHSLIAMRLDAEDGSVLGAIELDAPLGSTVAALPYVHPTGEMLLAMIDTVVGAGTTESETHVIKLSADLAVEWAFTAENASLSDYRLDPTESEIYVGGQINVPGATMTETDALFARIDLATGNILAARTVDLGQFDLGYLSEIFASDVYGLINTGRIGANFDYSVETTMLAMTRDLSGATAMTYTGEHNYGQLSYDAANDNFLFSTATDGATGALTIDRNLSLPTSCPERFTFPAITLTPGFSTVPLTAPITATTMTSTVETTSLTATTIPLEPFSYTLEDGFCLATEEGFEKEVVWENGSVIIRFPTEVGTTYLLYSSDDLENFTVAGTVIGDGTPQAFTLPAPGTGSNFYRIETFSF